MKENSAPLAQIALLDNIVMPALLERRGERDSAANP